MQFCSRQNAIPIVQCCPAKQAQSRQCDTAITPMEFCSSYRCAGSQHKCSSVQGKMQSPLFSAALQSRLTAGSASLQSHLWSFALHTGVQGASTNAVQLCSRQNAVPTVQCCSAKQAHSRQCVTAITPMEFCSSYRCKVSQHKCSAALLKANCNPHCSVLLCKTGSRQAVCHCNHSYGVLLFIQVCREPAQMQCSSAQGKMQSPLFSVALQSRLTAGSVSLQSLLWSFALHTGVK